MPKRMGFFYADLIFNPTPQTASTNTFKVKRKNTMIKGLAITPPILGRISIGKVVEKNGKRLPERDDQFTITSQIQNKEG